MAALPITVFSDFTCPFGYLTEGALRQRAAGEGELLVAYRALERFPTPVALPPPAAEPGWKEELAPLARELGLPLRDPGYRPRTRKAHETARFAAERGREAEVREALFRAYWGEGADIGRIDVLAGVVEGLGIDPMDLKIVLDIDQHTPAVLGDQALAARLGVTRVPTLFFGTGPQARVRIGLQSPAALDEAIHGG